MIRDPNSRVSMTHSRFSIKKGIREASRLGVFTPGHISHYHFRCVVFFRSKQLLHLTSTKSYDSFSCSTSLTSRKPSTMFTGRSHTVTPNFPKFLNRKLGNSSAHRLISWAGWIIGAWKGRSLNRLRRLYTRHRLSLYISPRLIALYPSTHLPPCVLAKWVGQSCLYPAVFGTLMDSPFAYRTK